MAERAKCLMWVSMGVVLMALVVFVTSCAGSNKTLKPNETANNLLHAGNDLTTNSKVIEQHVIDARKVTPEKLVPVLGPHYDGIEDANERNKLLVADLATAQRGVQAIERDRDNEKAGRIKAETDRTSKHMQLLVTLGVVG